MNLTNTDNRPYRPNVGICLFNRAGLVWVGRCETYGPEIVTPGHDWQMPQGGIEESEDIVEAARRELLEETGISSVRFLESTKQWWSYEFPVEPDGTTNKLNPFRGQKQKWVAFVFEGDDTEISITADHVAEPQEFLEWAWKPLKALPELVPPYKRHVYEKVVQVFTGLHDKGH